jgi:PhoH-like ATPase
MSKKIFVLDTNIIINDPKSVFNFEEHEIVIPFVVLEEIDKFKKSMDKLGFSARMFSKIIDDLREKGDLFKGVVVNSKKGKLRVMPNSEIDGKLDLTIKDNLIINSALKLKEENPKKQIIIVSQDVLMRVKADSLGISAESYTTDAVDINCVPKGYRDVIVSGDIIDTLFTKKFLEEYELNIDDKYPNEYFNLKNSENNNQQAICRYDKTKNQFIPLNNTKSVCGIKPKSIEQKIALDMLLNPDIKMVSLIGLPGSGKTLLSMAVGMEEVLLNGKYNKLSITKSVIPMGGKNNEIGFLPGDINNKMIPHLAGIIDNLEYIFNMNSNVFNTGKMNFKNIDDILDSGYLQIEALAFMRGRSISNHYIVFDETQNVDVLTLKTTLSRLGEGSKIIILGDPSQIDNPFLSLENNGLIYATDKLKHSELTAHIIFSKCERSSFSKLVTECL